MFAANLMYLNVLPLNELAFPADDRVAVAAANKIFPAFGTIIIAVLIMVSTFGCNNGLILRCKGILYNGKRWIVFQKSRKFNKNAVPQFALWIQCVVASFWY